MKAIVVVCFVAMTAWLFVGAMNKIGEWDAEWRDREERDRLDSYRRQEADD